MSFPGIISLKFLFSKCLFLGVFEKDPINPVDDFFRSHLDQIIDLRHPLAVLAISDGVAIDRGIVGAPIGPAIQNDLQHKPLSLEGLRRRCDSRGTVRSRLQYEAAAADDPEKGHPPLFVADSAAGFEPFVHPKSDRVPGGPVHSRSDPPVNDVVNMNCSGTTKYLHQCSYAD